MNYGRTLYVYYGPGLPEIKLIVENRSLDDVMLSQSRYVFETHCILIGGHRIADDRISEGICTLELMLRISLDLHIDVRPSSSQSYHDTFELCVRAAHVYRNTVRG
jgi:hypothetical protein